MTSVSVSAVSNTVTVTEGNAGTTVVTVPKTTVITAVVAGPQGPIGPQGPEGPQGPIGTPLPSGGVPGDILMKDSYANYDADWAPTLDGGTFF
jgi:hypothetical protein